MSKDQFMYQLQQALQPLETDQVREILADFEEHFANGLAQGRTEEQLAEELGNPHEIARQYRETIAEGQSHQQVRSSWQDGTYVHVDQPDYARTAVIRQEPTAGAGELKEPAGSGRVNEGMLILVILLNLFIALPLWLGLFGTLFGFWAGAAGVGIAACILFVVAVFEVGITSVILFLFGLSLAALAVIGFILMYYLSKLCGLLLAAYIRWNKRLVTGGATA